MRGLLLAVFLIFASCAPKTYVTPEIGMPYNDFHVLCEVDGMALSSANTVTNSRGSTFTIDLDPTPYPLNDQPPKRRSSDCVGKFVFVNGKLESISR